MTQGMKRITLALAAALVATQAHAAVGVKAGAWDFEVSGEVNGYAMFNLCDHSQTANPTSAVSLACNKPNTPGTAHANVMQIQSGLLPSALVFTLKTRQLGMDIAATVGFYPGIGSTDKNALSQSVIDLRQNFLTFGDKSWGTVKVGRDLGWFGDVILSDMTLLGVGSFSSAGAYVTFGHIGTGYMYADWIPQISYTTPDMAGFQAGIGVFQGLNIGSYNEHETPQIQAKLSYGWAGPLTGKIWVDGLYENAKDTTQAKAQDAVDAIAGDAGFKLGFSGLELVGYGYYGSAIGTTGTGIAAVAPDLSKRHSIGWFGQATYKMGRVKLGVNYGESRLLKAHSEDISVSGAVPYRNRSLVGGLYYAATDSLNLVAEYITTWSANQARAEAQDNTFALGAILFF